MRKIRCQAQSAPKVKKSCLKSVSDRDGLNDRSQSTIDSVRGSTFLAFETHPEPRTRYGTRSLVNARVAAARVSAPPPNHVLAARYAAIARSRWPARS